MSETSETLVLVTGAAGLIGTVVTETLRARDTGLRAAVLRFANVYGSIQDHADRVVPAFVAVTVSGATLRDLPPIHFVSGRGITLRELVQMACRIAGTHAQIIEASPRHFDVQRFVGDPRRARDFLDWRSAVDLESEPSGLASEFARGGP